MALSSDARDDRYTDALVAALKARAMGPGEIAVATIPELMRATVQVAVDDGRLAWVDEWQRSVVLPEALD